MDNTSFIHSLQTFVREVNKETGDEQIATIARVFARYEAPLFVEAGIAPQVMDRFTRNVRRFSDDFITAEIARKFAKSSIPTMLRNLRKEMQQSGKAVG